MSAALRAGTGVTPTPITPPALSSRTDDIAADGFFGSTSGPTHLAATINANVTVTSAARLKVFSSSAINANVTVVTAARMRRRIATPIDANVTITSVPRFKQRMSTLIIGTVDIASATRMRRRIASPINATVSIASIPIRRVYGASTVAATVSVVSATRMRRLIAAPIDANLAIASIPRMRRRVATPIDANVLILGTMRGGPYLLQSAINANVTLTSAAIMRRLTASTIDATAAVTAAPRRRTFSASTIDANVAVLAAWYRKAQMSAGIGATLLIEGTLAHPPLLMSLTIPASVTITPSAITRMRMSAFVPVEVDVGMILWVRRPAPIYIGKAQRGRYGSAGGGALSYGGRAPFVGANGASGIPTGGIARKVYP